MIQDKEILDLIAKGINRPCLIMKHIDISSSLLDRKLRYFRKMGIVTNHALNGHSNYKIAKEI